MNTPIFGEDYTEGWFPGPFEPETLLSSPDEYWDPYGERLARRLTNGQTPHPQESTLVVRATRPDTRPTTRRANR